jgi:hypothetical protein
MTCSDFVAALVAGGYVATSDPTIYHNGADYYRVPATDAGLATKFQRVGGREHLLATFQIDGISRNDG